MGRPGLEPEPTPLKGSVLPGSRPFVAISLLFFSADLAHQFVSKFLNECIFWRLRYIPCAFIAANRANAIGLENFVAALFLPARIA